VTSIYRQRTAKKAHCRGFSLVEMAIALMLFSMVFTIAITLVTRAAGNNDRTGGAGGGVQAAGQTGGFDPALVDAAILGFARANHRLPCPDVNGDGLEQCEVGGTPVAVGTLPVATLQIAYPPEESWRLPIDYGVYRGNTQAADLGRAVATRYTRVPLIQAGSPVCPPGTNDADCDVPESNIVSNPVVLAGSDNTTLNVLDSCQALATARQESGTLLPTLLHSGTSDADSGRVNVAYAFAWSGTPNLISGNNLLESRQGANPLRFHPDGISPPGSDDLTRVRSFLEVAQALDCSERFGDVDLTFNTAATLMTSEYLNRVRLAHMKLFRDDAADSLASAQRDIVFAGIDVALATAGLLLAIAEGTQGNPVAIANIVVMTAELANATAGLALTIIDASDAADFLNDVEGVVLLSRQRLNLVGDAMTTAQRVAVTVQQRGQL